jgi:hypothetical protein
MMRLLDIAILVSHSHIIPSGLHPIMVHQRFVALGELFLSLPIQARDGRTQLIRAMVLGDPSHLP